MRHLLLIFMFIVGCVPGERHPARSGHSPSAARGAGPSPAPDTRVGRHITLEPLAASSRLRVVVETPAPVAWRLPDGELFEVAVEPRRVRYEVASASAPCPFEVTPDRAVFCGAAVLPAAEEPIAGRWTLRLDADPTFYPQVASSFGLGASRTVRMADLRRAGFLFGRVHHARFDADVGRDHAAWVGFFAFDPRWVAAEAAGLRTAADRWLGITRAADDPPAGLLLVGATGASVDVQPLHRGAFVLAGPSASWGVRARLDITRLWLQRTIGGAITVDHPDAARWFDEGVAHGVALRVLRDTGVLTPDEVAGEVTAWLVADAFAEAPPDAHTLAVRGALLALALGDDLPPRLAAMLRDGERVASAEGFFPDLDRALLEGAVPVRREDVGPCARIAPRQVYRFALGFARDGDRVTSVDPMAARAGLRPGDRIAALDYVPGAPEVPVQLTVAREGGTVSLRYLPRGEARRARVVTVDRACAARSEAAR